jgi:UDP-3-O-[3-hydroxymyristoyl] glucosamine N-acyltransferase
MKLERPYSLSEIADLIGGKTVGDAGHAVLGINEIHKVEAGDLVFVDFEKYYDKALESAATTILIDKEVECPEGKALIVSDNPFRDFNKLTRHFSPNPDWLNAEPGSVGPNSKIHPNAVVGPGAVIGDNTTIHSGVVIYNDVKIGDNVTIHANSVIGADAFYFKKREAGYDKMHTCGSVVIEDDVEIGALSTVDRGVTGETRIGKGTKIDDHVHVGHDTVIGERCLFAAQVGIAGCVTIKNDVTLWGQVGVVSDVVIGNGVVVYGQSGIMNNLEDGGKFLGSPAQEAREKFKEMAMIRKLPATLENLK